MKISPEMRAAIDKAMEDGKTRVIPMGVSGLATEAVEPKCKPVRRGGRPRKLEFLPGLPPMFAETTDEKKDRRAKKAVQKVRDMRRFKTPVVPTGETKRLAPPSATGTMYPTKVQDPTKDDLLLKDGRWNSKIGGDVLKGRLKGARIYTLTLEERATCPRSCSLWEACYGNSLQHSTRWKAGPELEAHLANEVALLCHPGDPLLIRLHILGDFYSFDYLKLWVSLLDAYPNLNVFGFTAHQRGTKIGDGIARVREALGGRFSIRHSDMTGKWGSFVLDFPTARKKVGDAVVCPEQSEAMEGIAGRHCGNCGLCWASDLPIAFILH